MAKPKQARQAPLSDASGRPYLTDPTELTDKAIGKSDVAQHERVDGQLAIRDERLNGIDKATTLRLGEVDRWMSSFPNRMDEKDAHVKELLSVQIEADRRFAAAEVAHTREVDDIRFLAAEVLATRVSELNALALAAAFAAQKEASAKEAEYQRFGTIKTENTTNDAIEKLGVLFATQFGGLGDKVDDLKDRTGRIEAIKVGGQEQRQGSISGLGVIATVISIVVGLVVVAGFVLTIVEASKP